MNFNEANIIGCRWMELQLESINYHGPPCCLHIDIQLQHIFIVTHLLVVFASMSGLTSCPINSDATSTLKEGLPNYLSTHTGLDSQMEKQFMNTRCFQLTDMAKDFDSKFHIMIETSQSSNHGTKVNGIDAKYSLMCMTRRVCYKSMICFATKFQVIGPVLFN